MFQCLYKISPKNKQTNKQTTDLSFLFLLHQFILCYFFSSSFVLHTIKQKIYAIEIKNRKKECFEYYYWLIFKKRMNEKLLISLA